MHPLAQLLSAAADGLFPPADGSWRRMPPWRPGIGAVVALTGTAVVVDDGPVPDARLSELGADGFGGAHHPRVIVALAGPTGWVDSLDLVLATRGRADPTTRPALVPRPDLAEHPRVRFARALRTDVAVWGDPDPASLTVATVSTGLAGVPEVNMELDPSRRGRGAGARLVADVLDLVPAGRLVVAAVAPGNVASLRALLDAGFGPIASIQLFRPAGG